MKLLIALGLPFKARPEKTQVQIPAQPRSSLSDLGSVKISQLNLSYKVLLMINREDNVYHSDLLGGKAE